MTDTEPLSQLVVIGSSAGGVEALSTLVSTLPKEFPAPIVIAQHIDPMRTSHLGEILARRSTLPVRTVADHGEYEIRQPVRNLIIVGQHDLGQRAPFPRMDLVMCRNVLIYFTTELQRRVLQLFAFSLRDGGYLVLGKAETTNPLPDHFVLEEPRLKIYRRRGERVLIPSARIREAAPFLPAPVAPQRRTHSGQGLPQRWAGWPRAWSLHLQATGRGPRRQHRRRLCRGRGHDVHRAVTAGGRLTSSVLRPLCCTLPVPHPDPTAKEKLP